mgnify:CR=1 FL=1
MKKYLILSFLILLCSCGIYQPTPVDKCCETDVVYLDEIKGDSVNIFTSLDFNTITLDFRPRYFRGSDWYWGRTYGYWSHRPLWMDFDFHFGNQYSFYNPYFSLWHRPWNHWDWYMRPWRPANNWYQGPFNNPSYNVVYNASRRGSLTSNLNSSISNRLQINRNIRNTVKLTNYNKPLVISNNNDQINKPNQRSNWKPQSNNNGRGWRSREIIPSQSTQSFNTNTVQPRQIRGGSGSPVLQSTRPSINSSSQGRSSGGGKIN